MVTAAGDKCTERDALGTVNGAFALLKIVVADAAHCDSSAGDEAKCRFHAKGEVERERELELDEFEDEAKEEEEEDNEVEEEEESGEA